jgi:hypothetical protein
MFTSKSPVFSSNKLWAWSFPHHRAYRHCHFSSFSIEHFWNSECGIDLEGSILFFMAEWGVTIHEPCHVFNSTEIQLSVSISAPLTHLASNFSCTFPLYSLPLHIEYWIKGALAFHEKSAFHFHFTSSRIPSVRSLPTFLFVVSLYTKYWIKCVFASKSPVFSLNKLWAWFFPHRHTYQHCHFYCFSIVQFWNSECGIALEGEELPCMSHATCLIQLPVSISVPIRHRTSNFSRTFPLCSLSLHVEYWIKGALAFHKKLACHFYFISSHIPSVWSLPALLFIISLYTKY